MQRNSVQSLIGERASAHVKKSTRTRVNLCMPCKQGFNYSTQNGSESRFRDRCFFFVVELWNILWSVLQSERTPEPLFYVIGYCSVEGTSAS